ncbi:MAG: hypothetical protein Q8Q09_11540 [Deltaproteobacteria bacterium]|nr:hypothetical protein [Deltaproteobacteria bacterium]
MRSHVYPWLLSLCAIHACADSVRPAPTDAQADVMLRDASDSGLVDSARPDVPVVRDVTPTCPAGETAAGRCDNGTVVRCSEGILTRDACANGQRCRPPLSGAGAQCVPLSLEAVVITGSVRYERRPLTLMGLGAVTTASIAGLPVELVGPANTVLASGVLTDAMGQYRLEANVPTGDPVFVRVRLARNDAQYRFTVENFSNAIYAISSSPMPAEAMMVRDIVITQAANAGAVAIFDTIRDGLDFVRANLPTSAPMLRLRWERGRMPPGGTSYFTRNSNSIWLLGGPTDSDEFDLPVIFHEFGHFVEQNFSRTSSPGGSHDGSPTDPRLAWGEGWGTWFGCIANGSNLYLDANVNGSLRVNRDLANLPLVRPNMGDSSAPIAQPIGEYLVAGSLWALSSNGADPSQQLRRSLEVSTRFFTRMPTPDRATTGVDFVDFLDGYMCLHMEADRDVVQRYVVDARRFPYDFAYQGSCR